MANKFTLIAMLPPDWIQGNESKGFYLFLTKYTYIRVHYMKGSWWYNFDIVIYFVPFMFKIGFGVYRIIKEIKTD